MITPSELRSRAAAKIFPACGIRLDSPAFMEALLPAPRNKLVFGGWRAGKSSLAAADALLEIFLAMLNGRTKDMLLWIVGPQYGQTKSEYEYLFNWLQKLGGTGDELVIEKTSQPEEGPRALTVRVPSPSGTPFRVRIETKSAEHAERLGSVAPDLLLVVESGAVSGDTRIMMEGRSMEKHARIIYSGTLEDDSEKPRWAWYSETGQQWMEEPDDEHQAFSLPSWANLDVFPGGRDDPEIKAREAEWDEYTFGRRIAGQPMGLQYQVYPQLDNKNLLRSFPHGLNWYTTVGGIDYGTRHPSALVVVSVARDLGSAPGEPGGQAWVREVWFNDSADPGDTYLLNSKKMELSRKYNCWRWGVDPNERYAARNDAWSTAVSGSDGAREYRIGLTGTRLNWGRLLFDADGPGVPELYQEMRRVHRVKTRDGQLRLRRIDDDRTAALEDAIEVLDGLKPLVPPKNGRATWKGKPLQRKREFQRIS